MSMKRADVCGDVLILLKKSMFSVRKIKCFVENAEKR